MKKVYLVFNETKDEKHFAHGEIIKAGENLMNFVDMYKECDGATTDIIHICETGTDAMRIAGFWNDCYKHNGTYLYEE